MLRPATLALVSVFFAGPALATVVQIDGLPVGSTVDLSTLPTGSVLNPSENAFLDAGIAEITASAKPSTNNETYNSGATFGAGRALFGDAAGGLIALDEGAVFDFGSPLFTITFTGPVDAFGFRLADTSSSFARPEVSFFMDGAPVASFLFIEPFDAATEFGFVSDTGFDRVTVDVDTVGEGFGFDGVGITALTVGEKVTAPETLPTPVPLTASLPLMASALLLLAWGRRRA